jgi:hypothetical protein
MIVHEAPLLREPADLQQAGHRALAGRQDSPISNISACRQLRWKNSGAKLRITAAKRDGR